MYQPSPHGRGADSKRLRQLGAAFEAYRRAHPGRRFPQGLRAQVVAALEAGASKSAIGEACKLSWAQVTRWHRAAGRSAVVAPSGQAPSATGARVLSVVQAEPRACANADDAIEVRIGSWQLLLRRAVD